MTPGDADGDRTDDDGPDATDEPETPDDGPLGDGPLGDGPLGDGPLGDGPVARARAHLLAEHRDLLAGVVAAADGLDGPDADALYGALAAAGLLERTPAVLRSTVRALGRELPHEPVPAPPYVVVTSAGLVLRATLADARLVVTVRAFERRGGAWVRAGATPEAALAVELR